jgi:hypothetical protein
MAQRPSKHACCAAGCAALVAGHGVASVLTCRACAAWPGLQGMLGGAAGGFGSAAGFNAAALAAYAANASATANAAANMRVAVDKGRTTDYDHQFVAEDTTAKDHADEVMRRCEEVTKMLRKTLGKHSVGDPLFHQLSDTYRCYLVLHRVWEPSQTCRQQR